MRFLNIIFIALLFVFEGMAQVNQTTYPNIKVSNTDARKTETSITINPINSAQIFIGFNSTNGYNDVGYSRSTLSSNGGLEWSGNDYTGNLERTIILHGK